VKGSGHYKLLWRAAALYLLVCLFIMLPAAAADVFTFTPASPRPYDKITFTVSNPLYHDFTWVFSNGGTATGNPVTYTFTSPGTYAVTLHYTDSSGIDTFTTTSTRIITVEPEVTVAPASYITINAIGERCAGDMFTITATTNLAVGDEVLFQVYSSTFKPTTKTQSGEFYGATGTVKVQSGSGGRNTLSFDVDTSTFKPDEYIVDVQGIISTARATTLFTVKECQSPTTTTTTTTTSTTTITTVRTTTPTTVPTTVPPTTTIPPGPVGDIIFPWILLGALPLMGYVLHKEHVRTKARENCPEMPATVSFDGGIGMEDELPACLKISVEFSGGAEDDEAGNTR
jgi:PKD repeat protein